MFVLSSFALIFPPDEATEQSGERAPATATNLNFSFSSVDLGVRLVGMSRFGEWEKFPKLLNRIY